MKDKQKLALFDITMIVIGLVIGMGIFSYGKGCGSSIFVAGVLFFSLDTWWPNRFMRSADICRNRVTLPHNGWLLYKIFAVCYHPSLAFGINCVILISKRGIPFGRCTYRQ
jgi:APA family basic amino acid/polyamine antiporter